MANSIFLGKNHDERRVLVRHLREWASKNIVLPILISFVLFTFSSCEYWGRFIFTIYNNTNDTTYVSYTPQLRSLEDILPTYDHGKDYEQIRLSESDTTVIIPPFQHITFNYDVGLVSKYFPEENDTPENWGIVPLWISITSIVMGTDTLERSDYAKEKWERDGDNYTLTFSISEEMKK